MTPTCYMCSNHETSLEHVPPKCFFPIAKDFGSEQRNNLITVPSCDIHNSEKSQEDEYFRSIIVMQAQLNAAGKHQFHGKFLRGAKRSRERYRTFFKDQGPVGGGAGRALEIDRDRLDKCIDYMARAIFFKKFTTKWTLPIRAYMPQMVSEIIDGIPIPDSQIIHMTDTIWKFLGDTPVEGSNPDVFKYRIKYEQEGNAYALAAIFYNGFEVYTYSSDGIAAVV